MSKQYDFIIIGGGIAGLYAAYKIKTLNPNASFMVLEKQHKKWAGGRTGNANFKGTSVVTGAGVGRKRKDKLLIKLLGELDIDTHEFKATHNYATAIKDSCSVKNTFIEIKRAYESSPEKSITFKEFAISIIGQERYKNFIVCSGYADYEKEDVRDTLFNYGFDDNYENWTGLAINWKKLVMKLIEKIGTTNIKFGQGVEKIERTEGKFYQIFTQTHEFVGEKIIVATTIDAVLKIVPGASRSDSIYRQIHGQPFLRTYGKFSASSQEIMRKYVPALTIVPGPIQKIIPMDSEKGVYMICYNDNESAKKLATISNDTEENREQFCRILEKSLGLPKDSLKLLSIAKFYWPIGTHYYSPLKGSFENRRQFIKHAQRPHTNMLVVGEMISENQGWVEGALESVENVVTKRWCN